MDNAKPFQNVKHTLEKHPDAMEQHLQRIS